METRHKFFFADSGHIPQIKDKSVDLIVTSPPYPMIKMWDSFYGGRSREIKLSLEKGKGEKAFDLMHRDLDRVWRESRRVLKEGGIACVNIGDATRTLAGRFQLYSNHSRIIQSFRKLGFHALPLILWHKKTNAPNKFMGSGMLPAGAYVTLEHEHILIFRKGAKRAFKSADEKSLRQRSAFFWEERNSWFSDIWKDLPGAAQNTGERRLRQRSAAFPFELAYRLVCMHSIQSDMVLDPFAGMGTTALAAMAAGRNSAGVEIDPSFRGPVINRLADSPPALNSRARRRLLDHIRFAEDYLSRKGAMRRESRFYGFPVMTAHEASIQIPFIESVRRAGKSGLTARHVFSLFREGEAQKRLKKQARPEGQTAAGGQMSLRGCAIQGF